MNTENWKFLNEPVWKWALFILGLILILHFWYGVLAELGMNVE